MTDISRTEADRMIRAHHAELHRELAARVRSLEAAVAAGGPFASEQVAIIAHLDGEVMPHATAEEAVLYAAGDHGPTAMLVRAMREEHVGLAAWLDRLRDADDGLTASGTALAILALFESHLWKENELLLPALLADPSVDLGAVLHGMHELVG